MRIITFHRVSFSPTDRKRPRRSMTLPLLWIAPGSSGRRSWPTFRRHRRHPIQVPLKTMLTDAILDHILDRLLHLTIGVLGDLFCDRYLDIDTSLTEPSIETGLDAYQVVQVRAVPGAAGTVVNNLAALGVGRICLIS